MTGRWVSPVKHDRTGPVVISRFWMLTGNDQTLRSSARSLRSGAYSHNLNVLMTVEIRRSTFEAGDMCHTSRDRTLRSSVRSI